MGSGANGTGISDDSQMPRFLPVEELFKGRHFNREIVVLCVRWYWSFKLSYGDLVARWASAALAWYIRPFCAGCSITPPSWRSVGAVSAEPWAVAGAGMKLR